MLLTIGSTDEGGVQYLRVSKQPLDSTEDPPARQNELMVFTGRGGVIVVIIFSNWNKNI